ncbi:MAG: calcium/sodium antiporter [Phycisphaeraceae bacterium]|nr:calcium/sodium antiporter [Phycisphaerales bacterium]MCB9843456.1 calcium/sodium antiporter [Phycisphaeraceae bacterium]
MPYILLVASLGLLTLGAELLVRGSIEVARRAGLSSFFIGLTIVGFGTSTPELAASMAAALRGQGDIAVGNVVGSNIFNIAVILGIAALVCPIPVKVAAVRREGFIVVLACAAPFAALLTGGRIGRVLGGVMVAGLVAYLHSAYRIGKRDAQRELLAELETEIGIAPTKKATPILWSIVFLAAGLALLVLGARVLVDSATTIARGAGISELVIGLTIVAAGTSMPELATSAVAAMRRQPDIAVGNVLGSNIFNILGILGVTCVVTPQTVARQVFVLDAPVMLGLSVLVLPLMFSASRLSRAEGVALLAAYGGYLAALFLVAV